MPSFITGLLRQVGILSQEEGPAELLDDDIEVVPEPAPEPGGTRSVTLADLMSHAVERDAADREAHLARSMGLDVAWKTIFETAGIQVPANGWGVEKALAYIRKARSQGMTPVQIRASLEQALVTDGADVRAVLADAVAKDEVLDLYEVEIERHMADNHAELDEEIKDLKSQIESIEERIEQLHEEKLLGAKRLAAWKSEKGHLEKQWATVLHIVVPLT